MSEETTVAETVEKKRRPRAARKIKFVSEDGVEFDTELAANFRNAGIKLADALGIEFEAVEDLKENFTEIKSYIRLSERLAKAEAASEPAAE